MATCTHKPYGSGRTCGRPAEWWWRSYSGAEFEPRCHLHAPGMPGPNKVEMRGEK
jgi:hypothetical protein